MIALFFASVVVVLIYKIKENPQEKCKMPKEKVMEITSQILVVVKG